MSVEAEQAACRLPADEAEAEAIARGAARR
jgi:hypothetical protein